MSDEKIKPLILIEKSASILADAQNDSLLIIKQKSSKHVIDFFEETRNSLRSNGGDSISLMSETSGYSYNSGK